MSLCAANPRNVARRDVARRGDEDEEDDEALLAGIRLCAAAIAVVLASASCSLSPGHSAGRPSSAAMAKRETTSTVQHWGSFFGGAKGNFDIEKSPVTVTLPGTVAEVGTSNSTEYALLTSGSLYAWGLGTQGQLGDGLRVNSFTSPVRVHFPAGVKIASIPGDVMPYDTGLAVDTRGNVWGWGDNGGGELCLGNTTEYTHPGRASAGRRDRPGRGQQPCAVRRPRHGLRLRPERRWRPG